MSEDSVTRYVLTYVNRAGDRCMVDARQGRFTYATREEAQQRLDSLLAHNTPERLAEFFSPNPQLDVRAAECWPNHFDPMTYYFNEGTL